MRILAGLVVIVAGSPAVSRDILGLTRSDSQCDCSGYKNADEWEVFRQKAGFALAQRGPEEDDAVHTLCGDVYGTIFQAVSVDQETGDVTVTQSICPVGVVTGALICAQSNAIDLDRPHRTDYLENMLTIALHVLDFCIHCMDDSTWPLSVSAILDNYAMMVESPSEWSWSPLRSRVSMTRHEDVHEQVAWLRFLLHWVKGMESEGGFWREKLSDDPEVNKQAGARGRLATWLLTGEVTWHYDSPCDYLPPKDPKQLYRVLNSGSGPFAPASLNCTVDGVVYRVPVTAADGLARFYMKIFSDLVLDVPAAPIQCPVEHLHQCFPVNYFDVVHMRNALDHAFDPAEGIRQLLHVTKIGGYVLLRHAQNEGVPGDFRVGLHQWAFDVDDSTPPHFIIWNKMVRRDITVELAQYGEVKAELRPHPSHDAPKDEFYVWVDIRKRM